ncbi:serendipity locus protein alpha-like isoform X2 [Tenebrio molitor]
MGKYYREAKDKSTDSIKTLLLYLTQILTSLSLLINIFVEEEQLKLVVAEARTFLIKQITCCLESIQVTLDRGKSLNDPSGNFVKWMDAALDKISEIDIQDGKIRTVEVCEETRQLFEEVLSHAMSIAQVSLSEDSKIIRGSCQSVLSALNSLEKEISNAVINGAMVNLFVNACSDKLCILEKKVNTSVLKLCLKTFSQFTVPLEKIRNFCFNPLNKNRMSELDDLVADFDLHVDRIMQIGLFAISCSSDFARGVKITSCLASLEALESELVPALTSLLLDHSSRNMNCAKLLTKHWLNQAFCLQHLIYLIIDPFAFCQVIYDEAADIVDNLSSSIRKKNMIKQNDISCFMSIVKVLQTFLDEARPEFTENEANKIKTKLKDFNEVLDEVESATSTLLNDENIDVENCKRVLKRCKILLTVLKRLWFCFADDVIPNKSVRLVSDKQISDTSSKLGNLQVEPTGNGFLDHIINRGKQILQDRSVLYRTPVKNSITKTNSFGIKITKNRRKEMSLSKVVHLRKLSFVNANAKNETSFDLQITDILNEMTHLSTSLNPATS